MKKTILTLFAAVSALTMSAQEADTTIVLNYGFEAIDTITISKTSTTFQQMQEAEALVKGIADDDARAAAAFQYILNHPDSDGSICLLEHVNGFSKGEKCLSAISERAKNGALKRLYNAFYAGYSEFKTYLAKTEQALPIGAEAKDFTLEDINGAQLTLSSLRGKYVLLDFWASWCGPCVASFPHVKALYEQYHDKLQVLGVAIHDTKDKWKAAAAKHNLPWLLVIDTEGEGSVGEKYGLIGVPTYVLLDPEGKILGWTMNELDILEEFLK